MNFAQLLKRDLFFYRRTNLTLILLAAVCCAILTGALLVGDSVQYSLRRLSDMRLGRTQFAMSTGDRYFGQDVAQKFSAMSNTLSAPVLLSRGILESADGQTRINDLNIYGVDDRFWQFALKPSEQKSLSPGTILLSRAVITRFSGSFSELLLRFEQDLPLSRDLVFSKDRAASRAWPVTVAGEIADDAMGRFGLNAQQQAPLNVFVPIDWLADKMNLPCKANLLLVDTNGQTHQADQLNRQLAQSLTADDMELQLKAIDSAGVIELSSPRIFLDETVGQSAARAGTRGYPVFSYFVNELRVGDKTVPYSMVTSVDSGSGLSYAAGLKPDQIVINEWLAGALNADEGSQLTLTYYKPASASTLIEQTAQFTVAGVAPMMGMFADPTLMPAFPGLADAESCRDWDAGVPIDLSRVTDRDEAYWDKYKGSPKALVSLAAAQNLWSNRFGSLTAVRWPAAGNTIESLQSELMRQIDPAALGFTLRDVRTAADAQSAGSSDFAGLFAGLSMFLILSAAILLALVFVFYIESRSAQVGLLLAVGWGRTHAALFFLAEGAVLAAVGCAVGIAASILYTKGLIAVLNNSSWTKALASLELVSHATAATLAAGFLISMAVCLAAMGSAVIGRLRRSVHNLLTGTSATPSGPVLRMRRTVLLAAVFVAAGLVLPLSSKSIGQPAAFFLSGVLLLTGLCFAAGAAFKWLGGQSGSLAYSRAALAIKNISRRTGRSLAVLATAASGVFLVVGVGANHKSPADPLDRASGTGGFTLIAQATLPLTEVPFLAADNAQRMPGIDPSNVVSLKLYQQEDASCLNLNRVYQPTLIGVDPQPLAQRQAFAFQSTLKRGDLDNWDLLTPEPGENVIPVIGDYATLYWALGKNLGDTLDYESESGAKAVLRIVGVLKESLLQGRLFVSQESFERLFPSVDGFQLFLIDGDLPNAQLQAQQLSRRYRDAGLEVVGAAQKLAAFHEVENTYLKIFLGLGALGLLLGSAGLGLVLVLNVLDRRAELAMMQALGFRDRDLRFMLFVEHGILLAAGIVCGILPAMIAVLPSLWMQGRPFPLPAVLLICGLLLAAGAVWIRFAVEAVLRMNFLDVLRNE
jgi:putative ABC transport system permease protein